MLFNLRMTAKQNKQKPLWVQHNMLEGLNFSSALHQSAKRFHLQFPKGSISAQASAPAIYDLE